MPPNWQTPPGSTPGSRPDSPRRPPLGAVGGSQLSAAAYLVCLIVVPPATTFLSTCTLERDFPSTGLRLYWQSEGAVADTPTGPVTSFLTWRPDGSVEMGAVGAVG